MWLRREPVVFYMVLMRFSATFVSFAFLGLWGVVS